jgi:hypothetical protein
MDFELTKEEQREADQRGISWWVRHGRSKTSLYKARCMARFSAWLDKATATGAQMSLRLGAM